MTCSCSHTDAKVCATCAARAQDPYVEIHKSIINSGGPEEGNVEHLMGAILGNVARETADRVQYGNPTGNVVRACLPFDCNEYDMSATLLVLEHGKGGKDGGKRQRRSAAP